MLELKGIKKSYKTGDFVQDALKGIDLKFENNSFVSILGSSGSGKTTLLNIIGGLDRYDKGDLIINNKSTKKFTDTEWDAYRNNCIGFIFQSYNLITHLSVLQNIELSLTLSGVSERIRKKKALEALEKVGLKDHAHKRPNQLSGGQMQRVAIARALVNDPQVILADEPTGALDTKTSRQIMELIKEISKEKLVIMVTHNPELANDYSNRIIELKDGEVISDSCPVKDEESDSNIKIKKTKMSFFTALKLSFNNIRTKKGRTFLTAFASSIGIIGICLILSLSNGMDIQINKYERNTLSNFPVMISASTFNMSEEQMKTLNETLTGLQSEYPKEKVIYPYSLDLKTLLHTNNIDKNFINYVEKINPELINGISYARATNLNLLVKVNGEVKNVSASELAMSIVPKELDDTSFINEAFDILEGREAKEYNELMLVVDSKNRVSSSILELLGVDASREEVKFEELIGKEIKLVLNNDYYVNFMDRYLPKSDFTAVYENDNNIVLNIVGIARGKEDNYLGEIATNVSGGESNTSGMGSMINTTLGNILYSDKLVKKVIDINSQSDIVKAQKNSDYNVMTGGALTEETKENLLRFFGSEDYPYVINIYPKDFASKDTILEYLDKYNEGKTDEDKIVYNDLASTISSLSANIMDAVTIVLIAFSAVSLVVSSIMIGIITYTSVLERTKEIGVLRALGARKKDVSRVFNAETFIIGVGSGLLGILIARLMLIPINAILYSLVDIKGVAVLDPFDALKLIIVSTTLTLIGGAIPAKVASKKDPVIALRTE